MFQCKAKLARPEGVGTWTYAPLPKHASANLGSRGQVRVTGEVDGEPITSTLMADGEGGHFLVIPRAIREKIGKEAGASVTLWLEVARGPPKVEVPPELKAALAKDPAAKRAFDALAPSHRREHATHVSAAKKPETRARRAQKVLAMLRDAGK